MATHRPPAVKQGPGSPALSPWDGKTLRQALDLLLFSAAFGVLFNLLYVDGIELKVRAKVEGRNKDPLAAVTPGYPGLGKTPSRVTSPAPTPDPAAGLPRVSLMGAKDRFDAKTAVFLDARPTEEYKEAHIPGALNFYADEFDKFAPLVLPKLPNKDQEIICYCHGVSCELSIHLAKKLMEQGYHRVKVFFGGWPEWKKAGYPTAAGEAP